MLWLIVTRKAELSFIVPQSVHTLFHFCFLWVVGGLPEAGAGNFGGLVLLIDEMPREIMCILVVFAIAELVHKLCGSVAQMQRHGQVAGFLDKLQS